MKVVMIPGLEAALAAFAAEARKDFEARLDAAESKITALDRGSRSWRSGRKRCWSYWFLI